MQQPARYLGNEMNVVMKDPSEEGKNRINHEIATGRRNIHPAVFLYLELRDRYRPILHFKSGTLYVLRFEQDLLYIMLICVTVL